MRKHIKANIAAAIRKGVFAFFMTVCLVLACKGQKGVSEQAILEKMNDSLVVLLRDNYSGSESEEMLVVRSAKGLQKFFAKINRTRKPGLPIPPVDFSQHIVLIYCAGLQTDGKDLALSICEQTDENLIVCPELSQKEKAPNYGATISPFIIYKIPIPQKEIIFRKNR